MNNSHTLEFKGTVSNFFGIWFSNLFFSIITLGIYSAWAKVKTMRYFYSNTYLEKTSLEYHATPIQILKGRIVAIICVAVWVGANALSSTISLIMLPLFFIALPYLMWSNARFDSAMTSYNNVHFSFQGKLRHAYLALMVKPILILGSALIFTCGLYMTAINTENMLFIILLIIFIPTAMLLAPAWIAFITHNYFINNYKYGDWSFSAAIKRKPFFKFYTISALINLAGIGITLVAIFLGFLSLAIFDEMKTVISTSQNPEQALGELLNGSGEFLVFASFFTLYLLMILIGVASAAYLSSRTRNYVFSQLQLAKENKKTEQDSDESKLNFDSTISASGLVMLKVSNFLILLISLGLALPWVAIRTARFYANNTHVIGNLASLEAIGERREYNSAVADEVAQAFDVGFGL